MLFPNRYHSDSLIRAGREYVIPDEMMGFEIEIGPPYGTDILIAVATSVRTEALYTFRPAQSIPVISVEGGLKGAILRQKDTLAALPGDQKAEALATFTTVP